MWTSTSRVRSGPRSATPWIRWRAARVRDDQPATATGLDRRARFIVRGAAGQRLVDGAHQRRPALRSRWRGEHLADVDGAGHDAGDEPAQRGEQGDDEHLPEAFDDEREAQDGTEEQTDVRRTHGVREPFDWRHDGRDGDAATAGRLLWTSGRRRRTKTRSRPPEVDHRGAPAGADRGRGAGRQGLPTCHRRQGGWRARLDGTLGADPARWHRDGHRGAGGPPSPTRRTCGATRSRQCAGRKHVDVLIARR